MKTKEELNAIKEKVETLNRKLAELSEDELDQVIGGLNFDRGSITPYYTDGFNVDEGAGTIPFDCSGYFFELSNNVMRIEGGKKKTYE